MPKLSEMTKCAALLCEKPTRKKYCRTHRKYEHSEAFGRALRVELDKLPGAKFVPSYLDEGPHNAERGYAIVLQTRVSPLEIHVIYEHMAMFSRFDEPRAANAALGGRGLLGDEVNPFSGKWNLHFADDATIEAAVRYCVTQLRRVLP